MNDAAISLIRRLVDVDARNNSSNNGEMTTTTTAPAGCITAISSSRTSSNDSTTTTTTMIINEMRDFLLLLDENVHPDDNEMNNDKNTGKDSDNIDTDDESDADSDDSQISQSLEMISLAFGEKEQERILLQVQVFDEPEDDEDDDDGKDDNNNNVDNNSLFLDVDVSSHEYTIGDEGCHRLLQSLLGLNKQHTNFNNNNKNNSPLTTPTRTSSNTGNSYYYIRTLDLETNGLSAEAGRAVAAAIAIPAIPIRALSVSSISFFHRLEHLNLGCNNIGPEGCEHLAQQLQHLPSLEILDLHGNGIADRGCLALADAATALAVSTCRLPTQDTGTTTPTSTRTRRTLQALQVLDLSANRIEDAGAAALNRLLFRNHNSNNGCCCGCCPLLTTLNLRENGIESIAALVGDGGGGSSNSSTSTPRGNTPAPRLEQLHTLDVSWNSLVSLEALLDYHDKYPNLTDVDIRGNALADHDCHRLCSQLLLLNGDDNNNHTSNHQLELDDDEENPPSQPQIPVPVPVVLPPTTGESRLRVCLRLLADDHVTNDGLCRLPLWQWHNPNSPIPIPSTTTTTTISIENDNNDKEKERVTSEVGVVALAGTSSTPTTAAALSELAEEAVPIPSPIPSTTTMTTSCENNNNNNNDKEKEKQRVTSEDGTTTTAATPSASAAENAVAVRHLRRDGYVIQAPPLATTQTMAQLSTIMQQIEDQGYPPVFCFMHEAFWDFMTTHIWPHVTALLGVTHNPALCVLDAGSAFAWSLQATGKSTFPRDGEFRRWQNAVSNVNTTIPKEKEAEAPEGKQNYRGLGSSFGLPHRDYSAVDSLYYGDDNDDNNHNHNHKQHSPAVLTVWIPLNDATTTNGCMYVVPQEFDTEFATTDAGRQHAHMNPAVEVQRGVSSKIHFPLHGVRALPAPAGSLLAWYGNTIHWGASCSKYVVGSTDENEHEPQPRKSIALTFVRRDCSGALSSSTTTTTTTSTSTSDNDNDNDNDDDGPQPQRIHNPCPPISWRQATTMTARRRLSLISRSLLLYNQWHALADDAVPALIYDTADTTTTTIVPSPKKKTTTTTT